MTKLNKKTTYQVTNNPYRFPHNVIDGNVQLNDDGNKLVPDVQGNYSILPDSQYDNDVIVVDDGSKSLREVSDSININFYLQVVQWSDILTIINENGFMSDFFDGSLKENYGYINYTPSDVTNYVYLVEGRGGGSNYHEWYFDPEMPTAPLHPPVYRKKKKYETIDCYVLVKQNTKNTYHRSVIEDFQVPFGYTASIPEQYKYVNLTNYWANNVIMGNDHMIVDNISCYYIGRHDYVDENYQRSFVGDSIINNNEAEENWKEYGHLFRIIVFIRLLESNGDLRLAQHMIDWEEAITQLIERLNARNKTYNEALKIRSFSTKGYIGNNPLDVPDENKIPYINQFQKIIHDFSEYFFEEKSISFNVPVNTELDLEFNEDAVTFDQINGAESDETYQDSEYYNQNNNQNPKIAIVSDRGINDYPGIVTGTVSSSGYLRYNDPSLRFNILFNDAVNQSFDLVDYSSEYEFVVLAIRIRDVVPTYGIERGIHVDFFERYNEYTEADYSFSDTFIKNWSYSGNLLPNIRIGHFPDNRTVLWPLYGSSNREINMRELVYAAPLIIFEGQDQFKKAYDTISKSYIDYNVAMSQVAMYREYGINAHDIRRVGINTDNSVTNVKSFEIPAWALKSSFLRVKNSRFNAYDQDFSNKFDIKTMNALCVRFGYAHFLRGILEFSCFFDGKYKIENDDRRVSKWKIEAGHTFFDIFKKFIEVTEDYFWYTDDQGNFVVKKSKVQLYDIKSVSKIIPYFYNFKKHEIESDNLTYEYDHDQRKAIFKNNGTVYHEIDIASTQVRYRETTPTANNSYSKIEPEVIPLFNINLPCYKFYLNGKNCNVLSYQIIKNTRDYANRVVVKYNNGKHVEVKKTDEFSKQFGEKLKEITLEEETTYHKALEHAQNLLQEQNKQKLEIKIKCGLLFFDLYQVVQVIKSKEIKQLSDDVFRVDAGTNKIDNAEIGTAKIQKNTRNKKYINHKIQNESFVKNFYVININKNLNTNGFELTLKEI